MKAYTVLLALMATSGAVIATCDTDVHAQSHVKAHKAAHKHVQASKPKSTTKGPSSSSTSSNAKGQVATKASSSGYKLVDQHQGSSFFNGWNFWTQSDPTHGTVQYQSQSNAQKLGLISTSGNVTYMRADSKKTYTNGRPSVRISSQKVYNQGLFILDLKHMPAGCGTWPAFWTCTTGQWPNGGEIDIVEGVNKNTQNQMTLHTPQGCSMAGVSRKESGTPLNTNCDVAATGNAGCGVVDKSTSSFGTPFNKAGGGIFAMEWTSSGISMWHFTHSSAPKDLSSSAPNPAGWGTPSSNFPFTNCNGFFKNHQMIFDLTFCGDWAGAVYGQSGCPSTCADYVNGNPSAFTEAYWAVNYVRVFQK